MFEERNEKSVVLRICFVSFATNYWLMNVRFDSYSVGPSWKMLSLDENGDCSHRCGRSFRRYIIMADSIRYWIRTQTADSQECLGKHSRDCLKWRIRNSAIGASHTMTSVQRAICALERGPTTDWIGWVLCGDAFTGRMVTLLYVSLTRNDSAHWALSTEFIAHLRLDSRIADRL